jgi:uncharacterized protein involved in cysteine biosynthesis
VALCLLVPLLNLVVPPLAAVGVTLLFVHLEPIGLGGWARQPEERM